MAVASVLVVAGVAEVARVRWSQQEQGEPGGVKALAPAICLVLSRHKQRRS